MADEIRPDSALAVERLFEGKDHDHAIDVFANQLDAVLLPRPELRAHKVDDRDAERMEFAGKAKVDVGEVDEDGDVWPAVADGLAQLAELAVDARQVQDHFRDAHDGHVFRANDAVEAGSNHARPAHAEEDWV